MNPITRTRMTKIVATLGPVSSDKITIENLFRAGADVFRLNFSHGDNSTHGACIKLVRAAEKKFNRPIGILADLQGPKLRIGKFADGKVMLRRGQPFRFDLRDEPGSVERVQLPHPEIFASAHSGAKLLLDNGRLQVSITDVGSDYIDTVVLVDGSLSDRKGVNVPEMLVDIPAMTDKDLRDLDFALINGVDFIALSFIQTAQDVIRAREIIGDKAWIVSKIEKPQALQDIDAIIEASDAIMVARGDLGVELPLEDVPLVQKEIVERCRKRGRPVIVATQMLESMVASPTPTRAETTDIATAIFDGADAVMLSAETATGRYAEESVTIMSRIAARVETDSAWRLKQDAQRGTTDGSESDLISQSARQIAEGISAKAIVAYTHSGATGLRIARQRPFAPVIALTPFPQIARRLSLAWGIDASNSDPVTRMADAVARAAAACQQAVGAEDDDSFVVVAGIPFGMAGVTNALRISTPKQARLYQEAENDETNNILNQHC